MSRSDDITYRPRGLFSGPRVGDHASRAVGQLGAFRDQVSFMAYPDARRIDLRATMRDPFGQTFVRRFQQRASVDIYALLDLTGSLAYEGHARKMDIMAEVCVALARSATQIGDRFGLIGYDDRRRDDCFIPAKRRRGIATDVADLLGKVECRGASAEGLARAGEHLMGSRKMVFLISDFFLPPTLVRRTLESLAHHDIIPVVLGDSSETDELPDWGLLELADLETRVRRTVFMRPSLKRRWIDQEQARTTALDRLFRQFGRSPVQVRDRLDADRFSRQLLEG